MFDEYVKDLEKYQANVSKVFSQIAFKGAKFAVNTAKELTDEEGVVDTGYYRRNWFAERIEPEKDTFGIVLENNVKYASWIEDGYVIKKDYFVPFEKMEGTPKTKAFIARYKAKYPNAKGFIRKAGRQKGRFIGARTLQETHYYCIQQLQTVLERVRKKYHESFTTPEE